MVKLIVKYVICMPNFCYLSNIWWEYVNGMNRFFFKFNEEQQLWPIGFSDGCIKGVSFYFKTSHHTQHAFKKGKLKGSFTATHHPASSRKQMRWKGINSLFALIFCTSQSWETFQPFEHFCLRSGSSYKMQNGVPLLCLTARIPIQTRQGISHSLHLYFEPDYQKESQQ